MTAAQKTAKAKFKQAIAYRQKTGVSLKEAFAHIYGRKVGAVKKKTAPKSNSINLFSKIGDIEKYNGTIYGVRIAVKKELNKYGSYDLKIIDANNNNPIIYLQKTDKLFDLKELALILYKYIISKTTRKDISNEADLVKGKLLKYLKLLSAELKRLNKKPIKKAAPKKKVAKKVVRKVVKKKAAPKKKVAKKKLTRKDYDKRFQADKPGKRTSASGNTYYEYRENRSNRGKLLGIGFTLDKYNRLKK